MTTGRIGIIAVRRGLDNPRAVLAALQSFARDRGGWAQLVDLDRVAGRDHVMSAAEHARRAFERGIGASARFELEFLRYLSGEHQISRAIEVAGARPGRPFVAVIGEGPGPQEVLKRFGWTPDPSLLRPASPAKLRALGFSKEETDAAGPAAVDLVLDRVARVDLAK